MHSELDEYGFVAVALRLVVDLCGRFDSTRLDSPSRSPKNRGKMLMTEEKRKREKDILFQIFSDKNKEIRSH